MASDRFESLLSLLDELLQSCEEENASSSRKSVQPVIQAVQECVCKRSDASTAENEEETAFQAFCLLLHISSLPSTARLSHTAPRELHDAAMSLYAAFSIASSRVSLVLQVFVKVAHTHTCTELASECLATAREAMAAASDDEACSPQLRAQVLVESCRVALQMDSKALTSNVVGALQSCIRSCSCEELLQQQHGGTDKDAPNTTTPISPTSANASSAWWPGKAALEASSLFVDKAAALLEAGGDSATQAALPLLSSADTLLHTALTSYEAATAAQKQADQPPQPLSVLHELQEAQVQVLLLYIPCCARTSPAKAREALARCTAFLSATPPHGSTWWFTIWILSLNACISAQGIMSAATEVHAMVCNSVAPTCPVEVVCDAISLIATSLTTVAVDKVAHQSASLLVTACIRAAELHGSNSGPCILAEVKCLCCCSSKAAAASGTDEVCSEDFERCLLSLLVHNAVARALTLSPEASRAQCCASLQLRATELYQSRLYERARALLAPTLLFAPLHAFGSAARSVASCDLALKRYEDALSNLDLAEREASGAAAVCKLMKLRAILALAGTRGGSREGLKAQALGLLANLTLCADFHGPTHLQVAFNEALVAAQSSAAGSTELAACAAECAAHCMTLMKGGEAVNPDTQTAAVCPGRIAQQMLTALSLMQPQSTAPAPAQKEWVQRMAAEVAWASGTLQALGTERFTDGDHQAFIPFLLQAAFGTGVHAMTMRCWSAFTTAFQAVQAICEAEGSSNQPLVSSLHQAIALGKLHAVWSQHQATHSSSDSAECITQALTDLDAALSDANGQEQPLSVAIAAARLEAAACTEREGDTVEALFQELKAAGPSKKLLKHLAQMCGAALE